MPPFLNSYEYVFGEAGFILNTDKLGLPFLDVTRITGLDNAPVRTASTEHVGTDGAYVDAQYMTQRTIAIEGTIYDSTSNPESACDLLRAQYAPGTSDQFFFKHPGSPLRFVNAQGGGLKYDISTERRTGATPVVITLFCPDPYIYDFQPLNPSFTAQPVATQLNANSDFETGLTPWQATNSALLFQSSNALTGISALGVTPSGTIANPGGISEQFPVVANGKYLLSVNAFTVAAYASGVQVGVNWFTSGLAFISSTTSGAFPTTASTWTPASFAVTAPGTAAFAQMYVQAVGTPASSVIFAFDNAVFASAIGIGFPVSFNTGFGGPLFSANNSVQVTHNGSHTAYPIFVLKGPLTNPVITSSITSQQMRFNISLAASDVMVVDCRYKSVVLNGPILAKPVTSPSGVFFGPFIPAGPGKPPPIAQGVSVRSALQGLFWFSVPPFGADTYGIAHDAAAVTSGRLTVQLLGTYF